MGTKTKEKQNMMNTLTASIKYFIPYIYTMPRAFCSNKANQEITK